MSRSPSLEPLDEAIPAEILKAEVKAWAHRIGVEAKEIHVRPMRRKWASCSSKGRVTFAADLLQQPTRFRAEVIVHELVHLKVPNHGPLFRALLRAHLEIAGDEAIGGNLDRQA
jgi:predicted metal-dependent hydrolase